MFFKDRALTRATVKMFFFTQWPTYDSELETLVERREIEERSRLDTVESPDLKDSVAGHFFHAEFLFLLFESESSSSEAT